MISYLFGLPGSGKSTYLAYLASRELRRIKKGKSAYKRVLSNFFIEGVQLIDFSDIGRYDTSDSLILIDEVTLFADSRDHKKFTQQSKEGLLLHRHYKSDIWFASQQYDGADKKIRDVVSNMLYIRKIGPFSHLIRIPSKIIIPEDTGEILQGYSMPKLFERLFTNFGSKKWIFRRRYYKYFDSYEAPPLPVKVFPICEK